jgi:hypothetical protein
MSTQYSARLIAGAAIEHQVFGRGRWHPTERGAAGRGAAPIRATVMMGMLSAASDIWWLCHTT